MYRTLRLGIFGGGMKKQKNSGKKPVLHAFTAWKVFLGGLLLGGTLFYWPQTLDLFLVPRFMFLSVVLLAGLGWFWKDLQTKRLAYWSVLDVLLVGWYGWNLLSITWSISPSEGIFYAQKTLLLIGVYWFVRHALMRAEADTMRIFAPITLVISVISCVVIGVQVLTSVAAHGLNNEALYEGAHGLFGNKSLAAEFLFCLVVFQVLFVRRWGYFNQHPKVFWLLLLIPISLILMLQVRTAMLALVASALAYTVLRAWTEPPFRPLLFRRILPIGLGLLGIFLAFLTWKGQGSAWAERLNPLNYKDSDTANERRFVWYKTDLLNQDHYWLGVGNGAWKFWLPSKNIEGAHRLTESNIVFTRAHNDYLEIRAEMGIVGAVWFCTLFLLTFIAALKRLRKGAQETEASILVTAGAGLLGYCVVQYFDFPRERIEFQVVLGVLMALVWHFNTGFGRIQGRYWEMGLKILLLAGLLLNIVIGWQRWSGEVHNVRMVKAQDRQNWALVASEAQKAQNTFYQYTDSAIPLSWHGGVALYQLGQYQQAADLLAQSYRLNPWSFQVLNNYASVLVKTNQYEEAIKLYEKALTINPKYDEGKFNLSYVYNQMGDSEKAQSWLNQVDTIPSPGTATDRAKNAQTLQRLRSFQKALQEKQK